MVDFEKLPVPALMRIFTSVHFGEPVDNDEATCLICRRPFWWIFRQSDAVTLQLICKRWRTYYKIFVVANLYRGNDKLQICPIPDSCAENYLLMITENVRRWRRIFFTLE